MLEIQLQIQFFVFAIQRYIVHFIKTDPVSNMELITRFNISKNTLQTTYILNFLDAIKTRIKLCLSQRGKTLFNFENVKQAI